MRVTLDATKQSYANLGQLHDHVKELKKQAEHIKFAISELEKQKAGAIQKEDTQAKKRQITRSVAKHWFEKFRWFHSSEGFLCVGGRDATTNDILVKKHMDKDDIVFHTDAPGSPFFVVKLEGKRPGEKTLKEVAEATVLFSKAAKRGLSTTEVYWVKPEQLSKHANAGEFIAKGAFMVRGDRNYVAADPVLAVGLTEESKVVAGPKNAILSSTKSHVILEQGEKKASDVAKSLAKYWEVHPDDVLRCLPPGTFRMTNRPEMKKGI